jgi:hypothetical protein
MAWKFNNKQLKWFIKIGSLIYIVTFLSIFIKEHSNVSKTNSKKTAVLLSRHIDVTKGFDKNKSQLVEFQEVSVIQNEHPTTTATTIATTPKTRSTNKKHQGRIYHGRILKELCKRVLSRSVAQSNVLIVSPDVSKEDIIPPHEYVHEREQMLNENEIEKTIDKHPIFASDGPAKSIALRSTEEGHLTQLLPSSTNLNKWWNADSSKSNPNLKEKSKWYLMAYFVSGGEGVASKEEEEESIDMILHPSRVSDLLNDATLTYIVFGVKSQMNMNTNNYHENDQKSNDKENMINMSGLTAIQTLLDSNYKVQLLASSHLDGDEPYRPNHLFKSQTDLKAYLTSGAKIASASTQLKSNNTSYNEKEVGGDRFQFQYNQFDALLFATQGLDLAIPSRLSYIKVENMKACQTKTTKKGGRCDSKMDARALGQNVFLQCPKHHERISIQFDDTSPNGVRIGFNDNSGDDDKNSNDEDDEDDEEEEEEEEGEEDDDKDKNNEHNNEEKTDNDQNFEKYDDHSSDDVDLWLGHENPSSAEVACVKMISSGDDADSHLQPVSCTTRILRKPLHPQLEKTQNSPMISTPKLRQNDSSSSKEKSKVNFLSILIDPISRSQLKRSLPNTMGLLEKIGFINFERYTAVGDNSGPNQAALFTGVPLMGGRGGIKSSDSHSKDDTRMTSQWLWDKFGAEGYATLKAEDICIENSNMVQSLKPKTTHGDQLYKMFCFDYDRPNCLGKDMAAEHLVKYARQFMAAYGQTNEEGNIAPQPWAAFLSFVDSHEDTMTLISYLDEMFVKFLQTIDLSNTVVIFSSDHGLHYGPSFLSNGERERAEPILYMHMPPSIGFNHQSILQQNKAMWVTPFDVHETILDVTLQQRRNDHTGSSLLQPLPDHRKMCNETPGIPEHFCSMLTPKINGEKMCTFMSEPPSVHSFYADILRENRPSWPTCTREKIVDNETENCLCATNKPGNQGDYWIPCNSTRFENEIKTRWNKTAEPLRMKTCKIKDSSESTMEVNINIRLNKKILERTRFKHRQRQSRANNELNKLPNILFIEIDSLSQSAASRHLPQTISVLKSYQMMKTKEQGIHCPKGFCAAIFNKTSIMGQNSIPNQLAALSGCTDQKLPDVVSYKRKPVKSGLPEELQLWCPHNGTESPWLYNRLGKLGYVTFFGEEFCYSNSPWVIQGNLFKLNPDYHMNQLFCQLAYAKKAETKQKGLLYSIEHDTSKDPQPCIDGRARQELGFEYIRGIWNTYSESPKFAYFNALAAHDYSVDLAYQSLGSEAYDEYLSNFLKEMLQRQDAKDTIIIVRSDHGLQGGPSPIDFSHQVEHLNPFNTLIVPDKFQGSWLDNLYANQDKLVTGYDLYNTLRSITEPHQEGDGGSINPDRSGIPDWSYDLLSKKVPQDRTCKDAKIPVEFCPCVEERKDLMPYFYVGHAEKLDQMESVNFTLRHDNAIGSSSLEAVEVPGRSKRKKYRFSTV